ncbi:MAG: SDR family NAD(P)-dependent oxidoreductase [Scytonema sp. PMC 1069.18]|nr:SDR family NAD(P)-dependent oxidoreductase [Scytonema sp. PMC 1069.18]MEC4886136.1 SDR family NAD(P)-dependent oxidoreductase [Scytonema sp. PMC 1070.18]
MDRRLKGKVVIITGAGTGIGEAIAHKFAKEGACVVVNGLPDDPIEDVVNSIKQYSGQAVVYTGDVSQEFHAQNCVQTAINAYGKLDIPTLGSPPMEC